MRGAAYMPRDPFGMGELSVSISKAENGYLVTLIPPGDPDVDFLCGPIVGECPEPHQIAEMKEARKKSQPKVFVFSDLEQVWDAVKGFLLDARMPTVGP